MQFTSQLSLIGLMLFQLASSWNGVKDKTGYKAFVYAVSWTIVIGLHYFAGSFSLIVR